ncbi:MAG TPA: Ig-like domain-containing protein [Thermoanaerobaculia bacterium]|nr:Ig-like domain-containing protein [Thermoanaerobaculia bacterium]
MSVNWKRVAVAVLVIVAFAVAAWLLRGERSYVVVALIAALVGVGELVSRYRDAPERAIVTRPALVYVLINVAAGVAALYLVDQFGLFEGDKAANVKKVLLAGFGAMAFFRTALFTVRVGDQDVAVGPIAFLQVVLHAADRAVDRMQARSRATRVGELMSDVDFDSSYEALSVFCLALMQNLTPEEQAALGEQVKKIAASTEMDTRSKAMTFGLQLMNVVGDAVLDAAIDSIAARDAAAVDVSPPTAAVTAGATQQFIATARDARGEEIVHKQVTWATDAAGVATVDGAGRARAVAAGSATITATTADGARGAATLTVN